MTQAGRKSLAMEHSMNVSSTCRRFLKSNAMHRVRRHRDNDRPLKTSPARMVWSIDQARLVFGAEVDGCLPLVVNNGQ